MEPDHQDEERTWGKYKRRFAWTVAAAVTIFLVGLSGSSALFQHTKKEAFFGLLLVVATIVAEFILILIACFLYSKRPKRQAVRPADDPNLEAQEPRLEAREADVNAGSIQQLDGDAENASASSADNEAGPSELRPLQQRPSGEPSSSSLESGDKTSRPESVHSNERSNLLAPVQGQQSATLPDVASAVCEVASEYATGIEGETQRAENSTENKGEQSDSSKTLCRKRSQEPPCTED